MLNGATLGSFVATLGTNMFRGAVRPADVAGLVPHAALFVLTTGGPPPSPYFAQGGSPTNLNIYQSNVQVRVRCNVDDFGDGQATAQAVQDKLHLAALDLTGLISCKSLSSSPMYLGRDDLEHAEWSVNVTVWWEK